MKVKMLRRMLCCMMTAVMLCSTITADTAQAAGQTPVIEVISNDAAGGVTELRLSGVSIASGSSVIAPVWTSANGQDDIIWQQTEKKQDGWHVVVRASEHKNESGTYNIHFYEKKQGGSLSIIGGTNVKITAGSQSQSAPDLTAAVNGNGTVTITLKNLTGVASNKKVLFAVWGSANGQNDLVWYNASYAGGNTWTAVIDLAKHKETGTFNVHAYLNDGGYKIIKGINFKYENKYSGKLSVVENDTAGGKFRVKLSEVYPASGLSKILIPIWGEKDGQNDLKWYAPVKSGNDWYVDVDFKNHKSETGKYNIHGYLYDAQGGAHFIGGITVNVSNVPQTEPVSESQTEPVSEPQTEPVSEPQTEPADEPQTEPVSEPQTEPASEPQTEPASEPQPQGPSVAASADSDKGYITAVLKGYTSSPAAIKIAVWGEKNGQNDIIWYDAAKQSDGSYTISADITKHNETGTYNVHVYDFAGKSPKYIGKTTVNVTKVAVRATTMTADVKDDSVTITISNLANASNVLVPVWGDAGGQNDIVWYSAQKVDSTTWTAKVYLYKHNETGKYYMHLYADVNGAKKKFITGSNFYVNKIVTNASAILDSYVKDTMGKVTTNAMSQYGKLKACYDWVVKSNTYSAVFGDVPAGYTFEQWYAINMFQKHTGNCYSFACQFLAFAKELGYNNAVLIKGYTIARVTQDWTPHGWVEIDGKKYDPQMENQSGRNCFGTSPYRYKY